MTTETSKMPNWLIFLIVAVILLTAIVGLAGRAEATGACDVVLVPASDWASGNGVDVRSNGPNQLTANSCRNDIRNLSANPPQWGLGWQCVELAQRLYVTKGWADGLFLGVGKAADLFDHADALGFSRVFQGQVRLEDIRPGDMVVSHEYTYGHVALVDYVEGNMVHVVEQNGMSDGRAIYQFNDGSLSRSGMVISGIVHSPKNNLNGGGAPSGGSSVPAPTSPGTPQDGMVVENVTPGAGGHYYVAAGGSLFWFNKDDPNLRAAFIGQMRRRYGTDQTFKMADSAIHAIEGSPWANSRRTPDNNTFMYEQGSFMQYMMQYGKAFPVVADEIDYLGGRNRAVMVPTGATRPLAASVSLLPDITGARLLKAQLNPDYYEIEAGQFYHADNMTVVDCLASGHKYTGTSLQSALQPVPGSLIRLFLNAGRNSGQVTHCTLPDTVAFYGPGGRERWHIAGSNPYSRSLYASPLAMRCWLGRHPAEEQISQGGINQPIQLEDRNCPDNTYLRNNQTQQVFQVWSGVLHYIATPETLSCLTEGHPDVVKGLDEAEFGGAPQGGTAYCAFEGKQIQAPNGAVYWVKGGAKHYVGNQQILNCVRVRANGGDPILVPQATIDGYAETYGAYCSYPAEVRFVRGEGQAAVWRVHTDGTREYAQSLCEPVTDLRYKVHVMPAGEVDGHRYIGEFSPSPSVCAAVQ